MIVVVVHHIAEETVEVVETPFIRGVRGFQAEVPLADYRGVIASRLEKFRQQYRMRRQIAPAVCQVCADNAWYADEVGVSAG
jgi:hypothetical protein